MISIDMVDRYLFRRIQCRAVIFLFFFFFNDTATTEIYTLSLHDALPISLEILRSVLLRYGGKASSVTVRNALMHIGVDGPAWRSEEHTSELQSQSNLVCRLLLEKKKKKKHNIIKHKHNNQIRNQRSTQIA